MSHHIASILFRAFGILTFKAFQHVCANYNAPGSGAGIASFQTILTLCRVGKIVGRQLWDSGVIFYQIQNDILQPKYLLRNQYQGHFCMYVFTLLC